MAYWANGQVVAVADMPSDPIYTYANANVINGRFEYTGADLSTLKTAALVSWNDPTDFYRAKVEVVEDGDGIRRYGIRKTQIVAFGCTSRGQAQRVGLYHLYTSRMETGGLTFSVGIDGVIPQPGSLVKIADRNRAGRHIGGRVVAASSNRKSITLDRDHPVKVGDTLTVNLTDGKTQSRPVSALTGARIVTVSPAFTIKPAPESVWSVDADDLATQYARIISIKERDGITFDVSAVLHHPGKFAAIDSNVRLDPLPVSVAPPRAQLAPNNIQITPHHVISQGIARHAVEITWDAPEHAVLYDVQWRRDNGDWVQMPRTGVRTLELSDVFSGTYLVRVRAVNSLDVPSLWAYSVATEVSGTAGTPPVLASLIATGEVMTIRINWSYPNTPNIIERVQIRASLTNNFEDSYVLSDVAYPSNTYTVQGLGYSTPMWFWARLIDKNGESGVWHPSASGAGVFGQPNQDAGNLLEYLDGKISSSQLAQGLVEEIASEASAAIDVNGVTQELENQLSAQWGVSMQVRDDGRVVQTGVKLGAAIGEDGQTRSEFLVRADTVAFLNTVDGQIHTPFVFDVANDTAFLKSAFIQNASIDNAKIANAAIDSANIANGAITSAKIDDAAITTAKIGVAEIDTLRLKNGAVSISATAFAGQGQYWNGHALTCSISINNPAVIIVFAALGHSEFYNFSSYRWAYQLHLNGVFLRRFQPVISTASSQDGWVDYRSEGATVMWTFNATPGNYTVSFSSPGYGAVYFRRDILITALMR